MHPELVVELIPSVVAFMIKVVGQTRIFLDVEHRSDVLTVGLKHVVAVGLLVDIVEIASKTRLLQTVEHVAAEAEHCVIVAESSEQTDADVGLLS